MLRVWKNISNTFCLHQQETFDSTVPGHLTFFNKPWNSAFCCKEKPDNLFTNIPSETLYEEGKGDWFNLHFWGILREGNKKETILFATENKEI